MHKQHTAPPPLPGRDVFNERPVGEEAAALAAGGGAGGPSVELPHGAIIRTSRGDIWVKLFPDEVGAHGQGWREGGREGGAYWPAGSGCLLVGGRVAVHEWVRRRCLPYH